MLDRLDAIREQAFSAVAAAADLLSLEKIETNFLGRKGVLTSLLRSLGSLPLEQRPQLGSAVNALKQELVNEIEKRRRELKETSCVKIASLDITLPGRSLPLGRLHPITQVLNEICDIFQHMGFGVAEGPEVELDFYNFEALNIPANHPARDMQDTFYVDEKVLLRTHTSPIQVRTMERLQPPLRIIAPGKVYRCDSDVTHTPMFHQVEGLMVDTDISFAYLKGTLTHFIQNFFDSKTSVRFRPSFFPFTEPSAEVDIQCVICRGKGCRVCSNTGWLEVLGAGMVHPAVFRSIGYDAERYTGFAFGLGIERFTMLRYGIDDIRLFYENDLRFLRQF